MRLHPNTISYVALVAGVAGGFCYWAAGHTPWFYLGGAALITISGLLDCFDGIVARETGTASSFGDFLDHVLDRIVNMAIFFGLALSPNASTALGLAAAILVLMNSYLGTQIHASFGSRDYTGLGKAQLFIALVAASVVLFFFPDAALDIARGQLSLVDGLFILIAIATLQAMVHRIRLARRLATRADRDD